MSEETLVKALQQARRAAGATAKELTEARATRMRLKARRVAGAKISLARIAAYTVKVGLLDSRLDELARRVKRAESKLVTYRARNGAVKISDRGVAFVKGFEGFSPRWYDDGLG